MGGGAISYLSYLPTFFGLFGLKLEKTITFSNQTFLCLRLSRTPTGCNASARANLCVLTLGLGLLSNFKQKTK